MCAGIQYSYEIRAWVDELRSLPALHLLESIRRKLMKRANKRLEAAKKWNGNVPPAVCKKLAKMQDEGLWQVSGIPCKHAMAMITTKRLNSHDFVHKYLNKEYYLKTYSHVINPIPKETLWPKIEHIKVLPLMKKKMPRRPKKNRKRSKDEPAKHKRSG
ncbi:hypothetical protein Q3G72_032335 [Acer saccharum]|nr:hypothetical protein Q3G72_032335 [Acer saccharum]